MGIGKDALWATGHDESVEVNQRALIDKVLARYSGEFTVFRELLQNSDDAQATAVEIHFETQKYLDGKGGTQAAEENTKVSLPDLKTTMVHQWTFKNNGIIFRDEDWNRLKKIAEGNPDEEKIGAFGVGFYSLFSVTEEPFVTSGGQWMGFYWKDKKDQLFARRGQLPDDGDATSTWTTFEMLLREDAPIPVAFDFTRFLASSITFMTHLSEVSLYFDDKRLAKLTKSSNIPKELGLPKGLQNSSRSGIVTVQDIKCTPLHIKAEVMRWVYSSGSEKPRPITVLKNSKPTGASGFFSSLFTSLSGNATPQRSITPLPVVPEKPVDLLAVNETSVLLSIFSANVDIKLSKKVAAELHRSTKKNPPNKIKYELIYTAKDEYDASKKEDENQPYATGSIFQGLRADLDGSGFARVFIGHATAQTTGLGGHMAARFIPTVERESIDLMDRNVAIWNRELLYVGGFLARAAYELELTNVKRLWEGAVSPGSSMTSIDQDLQLWLRNRSLHALKFFTFHPSTPSADVSNLLETAFFSCGKNNHFSLISTAGVQNASDVRLPDPTFAGFLKQLPVLPDDVLTDAPDMVASLQSRGLIKPITFEDVLRELKSRPLTEDEMVACLKWWIGLNKQGVDVKLAPRTELLNAAVLTMGTPNNKDERIIPLNSLRTFINTKTINNIIPLDGPLPNHLLPVSISKAFSPDAISSSFPWTELTISEWVGYICSPMARNSNVDHDINVSATWAERVLTTVARAWPTLPSSAKAEIAMQLKVITCIPTSGGMKTPEQSYFVEANIFNDLPVVTLPSGTSPKGSLERVLQALGVRKHVELQIVFNRMIKTNEWTVADLAKYLVSVQSTLTQEEWARLKMTAAFSKELNQKNGSDSSKPNRYQAQQLYEPLDVFRQLGLPVIDWGKQSKWRASSDEAKFLFELGLIRFPPLSVLINLCADTDTTIRTIALKYLLDNIDTHYKGYNPALFGDIAFIPAVKDAKACLGTPKDVFSNSEWSTMGFLVTHSSLQPNMLMKLKIKQHPPTSQLVELLEKSPPKDEAEAKIWFGILAGRIHEFTPDELKNLSQLSMVPVPANKDKEASSLRYLPPIRCYFGGETKDKFHSKLFVFVNFGSPANAFLSACGTKREPSVEELTIMLLEDPRKFYAYAEGPTQFLAELRNIAANSRLISSGTLGRMKKSAILLGSRRKPRKVEEKGEREEFDDDDWDLQYDLRKPDEIIIADDTHAHQAFGDSLFTAPQEDTLESFYAQLGSKRLSSLVKEEYQSTAEVKYSKTAEDTRALILERLPLFLHEHTHARTRVSYSWLTSPVNFVVKTYGKISVTKSLNFGELRLSRKQDASAVAQRTGYGPIQLLIAGNSQVDMYEVATSLNRLIFDSPKANDALLFMTILSTDLKALKRRGYNVDRILRQQKAERQAAESAKAKAEGLELFSQPPSASSQASPTPISATSIAEPSPKSPLSAIQSPPPPPTSKNPLKLFNLKRKTDSSTHADELPPVIPPVTRPIAQQPTSPGNKVTPLSNISSNIDMAIKACRPESGNLLRNREEMRQVKESLNEGYCDISGQVGDLNKIGEMGRVKVYLSHDVPDPQTFMATKRDLIARFVHILVSLSQVYDLPLTSLHVFNDLDGGLIAFNRNGSIFLNLRYYLEWHDKEVSQGNLNSAYISWYFTLAHEIAHNLVQPHNSEHEFYFSAICEKHLMGLGQLLTG